MKRWVLVLLVLGMGMGMPTALAGDFEGWKQATVDVDEEGRVVDVDLVSPLPDAMAAALRQEIATWLFAPAQVDGRPASSRTHMEIRLRARPLDEDRYGVELADVRHGPKVTTRPGMRYPSNALKNRIQGTVYVRVGFDESGQVIDVVDTEQSRAHSSLVNAAVRAVRSWRFQPEQVNGHPIAGSVIVPLTYCISGSRTPCPARVAETFGGMPMKEDADLIALDSPIRLISEVEIRLLSGGG